jgi:hypothetical protein
MARPASGKSTASLATNDANATIAVLDHILELELAGVVRCERVS